MYLDYKLPRQVLQIQQLLHSGNRTFTLFSKQIEHLSDIP